MFKELWIELEDQLGRTPTQAEMEDKVCKYIADKEAYEEILRESRGVSEETAGRLKPHSESRV